VSNVCQNQVGEDVKNECTQTAAGTCGDEGTCDGNGGCKKWSAGTACQTQTCSGGMFTPARQCNGSGTCSAVTTQPCSGNLGCSGNVCRNTCTVDGECVSTQYYCAGNGTCALKKAAGQPCTASAANQCATGNCVDGVCCNFSSCTSCSACGANGNCNLFVPKEEEDLTAPNTCSGNLRCDGKGACKGGFGYSCQVNSECASGWCRDEGVPQPFCSGCGMGDCCPPSTGLPACNDPSLTCSNGQCVRL
jgi:hypothetical protein